jgi:hypothetical protein
MRQKEDSLSRRKKDHAKYHWNAEVNKDLKHR